MPPELASSPSRATAAVVTMAVLALLFFLAIDQLQPPLALPASAPVDQFSAFRALDRLRVIAQAPHPTGSTENARVRAVLVGQLGTLGLGPEVQTTSVARTEPKWQNRVAGATVSNVVARLQGTANTRPVMFAAHYDSVPSGPGASDDGSGVVTLLETARALRAGPALRNDIIFLFTDGEEAGLLGAQAFVNEHPWAKEPGVVLNFEARGACGPSFMFETSPGNGWLIRQFAGASPYPAASSFTYEAYKRLPNDTDLTVFKRAGLAGLNFAYVGCWTRYHTWGDTVQNLDLRSLQHDGSYALALARRFGNLDLTKTSAPDAEYFNVFRWVVRYPESWALPLLALALVLGSMVLVLGFGRRRLTWQGVVAGCLGWLLATAAAAAASELIWRVLRSTRWVSLLPYGMAYNGDFYAWAFVALMVAAVAAAYAWLFPRFGVPPLTVGALIWWAVLAAVVSLGAPGASYLLLWPLLAAWVELAYAFTRRRAEPEAESVLLWTLPALVCILLFGWMPYALIMLVGTLALVPLAVTVALLVGYLVPHLHILTAPRRWWLAGASALVAAALMVAGMATSGYDASHPRADSIFYALDADSGRAFWVCAAPAPDPWTSQFLTAPLERGSFSDFAVDGAPAIKSPAPKLALPAPDLSTLDDVTLGNSRLLRLRLSFAPGTRLACAEVTKAHITGAEVNGKRVTEGSSDGANDWELVYTAPPPDGLLLTLELGASDAPVFRVFQDSDGLPNVPGFSFRPRPPDLMPSPWWPPLDSSTVVSKSFEHLTMRHAGT
jgi:hypothetical protein